jgi:hypothetical protein
LLRILVEQRERGFAVALLQPVGALLQRIDRNRWLTWHHALEHLPSL